MCFIQTFILWTNTIEGCDRPEQLQRPSFFQFMMRNMPGAGAILVTEYWALWLQTAIRQKVLRDTLQKRAHTPVLFVDLI